MTNSNTPARQQGGTLIRKKLYFEDFRQVDRAVTILQDRGVFQHQSKVQTDQDGTFVVIAYRDPLVVPDPRPARSTEMVPVQRSPRLAFPQRSAPAVKPVHKRWWFVPSVIAGTLAVLCGAGYWALQQLKQVSAPNIGVGVVGFLFVVVLIVWIVKNLGGGGGGGSAGHSGGHGFHYGPCK